MFECHTGTGMELRCLAKGAPLCVPSALGQEPRRSGLRFKSNKLLQHFRDGIWRYQHAKPGRGWPIALPTRPWELLLPRLRRGDLCQCRALKYHGSACLPSSCLHFTHPQTDSMTQTHFITYYPFIFILCRTTCSKGCFFKATVGYFGHFEIQVTLRLPFRSSHNPDPATSELTLRWMKNLPGPHQPRFLSPLT